MILPSITFVILLLNHCLCCSLYYMEGCHILYKYKLEFKNACQWLAYDICKMVWEGFDGKVWWWLCTRLGVEKTKRSMIFLFVCFHPSGIWCCVFLTDICCLLLFYTYLCYIDTSTLIVTRFLISWWSIWTMRKLFHYPCDISFCFYCLLAILCEFAWVECSTSQKQDTKNYTSFNSLCLVIQNFPSVHQGTNFFTVYELDNIDGFNLPNVGYEFCPDQQELNWYYENFL
jgi:hypothetical protein